MTDDRDDAGGWDDHDPPIGFRRDPARTHAPAWLKPVLMVLALIALVAIAVALVSVGNLFEDAIP